VAHLIDTKEMAAKTVAGLSDLNEAWGPALKESGFQFCQVATPEEALHADADFVLMDARQNRWIEAVTQKGQRSNASVFSVLPPQIKVNEIAKLFAAGVRGFFPEDVPAEEVVVRLNALVESAESADLSKDARSAQRIWFQQKVRFKVFDREHTAWSTTLSETGIFLRTPLSFPLYTVIRLQFDLFGMPKSFEADGVIVRQEVEGSIRGLGVMFQNLKGEAVASLEAFLQTQRS
jgi:hypothetical protein